MSEFVLPAEFVDRMREMLGDEWPAFLHEFSDDRDQALRFRAGRHPVEESVQREILRKIGIAEPEPVPWARSAWYYRDARPGKMLWHDAGAYYIQEPSAMSAAPLMEPQAGERVLDLCAAPGGKTTQLADAMGENSLLVANEIHSARCRILSQNVERMGIGHALVTNEPPDVLAARLPRFFHRILVDAPCSGEGMFRKNPLAAEEWSPENVQLCADRQDDILDCAAEMLTPGGRLVYSTCTFAPAEDEGTIARFLGRHPEFELVENHAIPGASEGNPAWAGEPVREDLTRTIRLWPHRLRGEGHFAAVLAHRGSSAEEGDLPRRRKKRGDPHVAGRKPDRQERAVLQQFLRDTIAPETAEFLMGGELVCFGEQVYRLPPQCPSLEGIHVLRAGLHLGTLKKQRLEPAHALAMWLNPRESLRVTEVSEEEDRAEAWFRGESISAEGAAGWTLVAMDGFSAGWGKRAGGLVKNHLPKGLRHMGSSGNR